MLKMKNIIIILLLTISIVTNGQYVLDTIQLKEIAITSSYTAKKETPFSFSIIDSKQINFRNQNVEPAVLLSTTPSINHYSDNGLDIGYTYFRLRGIDQTRINSSLNGVPLNEPEDQGIYYNNFGDFSNSLSSIQIIRGAGLSKGGNASYGGSINFNSPCFNDTNNYEVNWSHGSYNTPKVSGNMYTKDLFLNVSVGSTDGYRYNTGNEQYSIYYGCKLDKLTLYGFVANQKNGMGWLGESLDSIKVDPRYNSNKPNEVDNFTYVHNQIIYAQRNLSLTVYHTYLDGWYDTDIAHFDPTLQWGELMNRISLQSNWFGGNFNYNLKNKLFNTNIGINTYTYYRQHIGSYNEIEDYTNTGTKNEFSPYIKEEFKIQNFTIYSDIQYRYTTFSYEGSLPFETIKYNFLNYSGGLSYKTGVYSNVYYGIGQTYREPTRSDLFSGNDNYDSTMYNPTVPESVLDQELGFRFKNNKFSLESNLYYMHFNNEIVLNGKYGPNSVALHENVDNSFRSGIELNSKYLLKNGLEFILVGNYSYNRIKQDSLTFSPVLTPNILIGGDIKYNLRKLLYVGVNIKYNGESYIDLANENILPSYTLINTYFGFNFPEVLSIQCNVNNITNKLILGNAMMGYDNNPLYFTMAGINGNITITYKF